MLVENLPEEITNGALNHVVKGPTEIQLPLVPEQVTPEWLSSVMGAELKSIEFTRLTLIATASKLHITLNYCDEEAAKAAEKPMYICVKGGFNPAIVAAMPHICTIYQREADFFSNLAPALNNIELLKCWWSGTNSKQGIVILDDLDKQGMQFGKPTDAWPVDRVLQGVEQLAGLHAGTWAKTVADFPWLRKPEHYNQTIMQLVSMWPAMALGEDRPAFPSDWNEERLRTMFTKHFAGRDPRFLCMVHGDPHCVNTWLDAGRPRFLDWQLIHVGSAFHDVAYYIVGSLTVAERKRHELAVLEHYLGALERFGGPALRIEEVLTEYKKSTVAGIGWMLTPYTMQPKEQVLAMAERYTSAIVDHKAVELIESM